MTPCSCRKNPVEVEKNGKSLCRACAGNYPGREFPIRSGRATVANFSESGGSKRTFSEATPYPWQFDF